MALLAKMGFYVAAKMANPWADLVSHKYLARNSILYEWRKQLGSWGWKSFKASSFIIEEGARYKVGDVSLVELWFDPWTGYSPLISLLGGQVDKGMYLALRGISLKVVIGDHDNALQYLSCFIGQVPESLIDVCGWNGGAGKDQLLWFQAERVVTTR